MLESPTPGASMAVGKNPESLLHGFAGHSARHARAVIAREPLERAFKKENGSGSVSAISDILWSGAAMDKSGTFPYHAHTMNQSKILLSALGGGVCVTEVLAKTYKPHPRTQLNSVYY